MKLIEDKISNRELKKMSGKMFDGLVKAVIDIEKEILRAREALIDHFIYDNDYNTTDEQWQKYFYQFNYAAAMKKGR